MKYIKLKFTVFSIFFVFTFVLEAQTAPEDISIDNSTFPEMSSIGTVVGKLSTTDNPAVTHHTYLFSNDSTQFDNSFFSIINDELVVDRIIDFENPMDENGDNIFDISLISYRGISFFGSKGLPDEQGFELHVSRSSVSIDLQNLTINNNLQQVVRLNDDAGGGIVQVTKMIPDYGWPSIFNYGGSFSGHSKLDSSDGQGGFFAGIQNHPEDKRYGILFQAQNGKLYLRGPDPGNGLNVVMNGLNGNPDINFDEWFEWRIEAPANYGPAEVFINDILVGTLNYVTNVGGGGNHIIIGSGSTSGKDRISYHERLSCNFNEFKTTKNFSINVEDVVETEISGNVFYDENGNGLKDVEETTNLEGISVSLYYDNGAIVGSFEGDETLISTTTTNADGTYSFLEASGNFIVVVDANDENLNNSPLNNNLTYGLSTESNKVITLTNSSVLNIDFGFDVPEITAISDDIEIYEGRNDNTTTYRVLQSIPSEFPTTVTLDFSKSTATYNIDFNIIPGLNAVNDSVIVIPAKELSGEIQIESILDLQTMPESDEEIIIDIASVNNAQISESKKMASIKIMEPIRYTISGNVYHDENLNGNLDIEETSMLQEISLSIYVDDGDVKGELDYNDFYIETIETSSNGSYSFDIISDDYIVGVHGNDEDLYCSPINDNKIYGGTSHWGKQVIVDRSSVENINFGFAIPEISLDIDVANIYENEEINTATYTLSSSLATDFPLTFEVFLDENSTAQKDLDFQVFANNFNNGNPLVQIAEEETSATFYITSVVDVINETLGESVVYKLNTTDTAVNYGTTEQNLVILDAETLGNDDLIGDESKLYVYPNPVSNSLYIKNELQNIEFKSIIIFDSIGNKINQFEVTFSDTFEFNVSHLNSGIYFIHFNSDSHNKMVKFVKI